MSHWCPLQSIARTCLGRWTASGLRLTIPNTSEFSLPGISLYHAAGVTCWLVWLGRPDVVPVNKIHFGLS